jgi:hypothetical protein
MNVPYMDNFHFTQGLEKEEKFYANFQKEQKITH